MIKISKLHEILAVEGELEGIFKKTLMEAAKTFDRGAMFEGFSRSYSSFLDEEEHDVLPDETQEITTTVPDKIDYVLANVIRYFDCTAQKDAANQAAKADVIIDGKTLVADVPATTLLGLESKLKQIREVFNGIPTLPIGARWVLDEQAGKHIYRSERAEEKIRTRKRKRFITVAEPTKEHPAQVKEDVEDQTIGKYTLQHWSGCLTSARKSEILGKVDKLARAVKQARQRANCVDVPKINIGEALTKYIVS